MRRSSLQEEENIKGCYGKILLLHYICAQKKDFHAMPSSVPIPDPDQDLPNIEDFMCAGMSSAPENCTAQKHHLRHGIFVKPCKRTRAAMDGQGYKPQQELHTPKSSSRDEKEDKEGGMRVQRVKAPSAVWIHGAPLPCNSQESEFLDKRALLIYKLSCVVETSIH